MNSKNYINREVEKYAFDETLTGRHMVFIAGPRQVGKTVLAKNWAKKKGCESLYFNWDDISTRHAYFSDSRFFESPARALGIRDPWIVFHEIHKRNQWRDILKGVYDIFGDEFRFLITGSARLNLFRRSGDSLVGRYNLFHMMPLSIREVTGSKPTTCFLKEKDPKSLVTAFKNAVSHFLGPEKIEAYKNFLFFGPFPEPFLKQSERFCRKWHQDYHSLLIRQDLRDISRVTELDKIENLLFLLAPRIMAPLSMANLSNELEVAHTTVKSWLEQLKRLYLVFPVSPWSKKISRGIKKEKKWYFMDWYYAPDGPARMENMVATCLYRACLAVTDMGYGNYTLHFVRTIDKKEIDFIVARDNHPIMAVEVKTGDTKLSKTLKDRQRWFQDTTSIGVQIVEQRDVLKKYPDNTWLMSVERFLSAL